MRNTLRNWGRSPYFHTQPCGRPEPCLLGSEPSEAALNTPWRRFGHFRASLLRWDSFGGTLKRNPAIGHSGASQGSGCSAAACCSSALTFQHFSTQGAPGGCGCLEPGGLHRKVVHCDPKACSFPVVRKQVRSTIFLCKGEDHGRPVLKPSVLITNRP